MAQTPLHDAPSARLSPRLHAETFGQLPTRLVRALDVPAVATAVRPLLQRGWRPAQLATRVGALPAPDDPVPAVVALLQQLLERESPQQAWDRERAERKRAADERDRPEVASPEVRDYWIAQARRALGVPASRRPPPRAQPRPLCACCSGPGAFFVTRDVRLCPACVGLLGSGRAQLSCTA